MAMRSGWSFCDGEGRLDAPRIDRRTFIGSAVGAAIGVWWASPKSALAQAALSRPAENRNVLVSIFLRGGADALNIIVPYGEDEYYRLRPSLALAAPKGSDPTRVLDLDGFFGLNPALEPLAGDYREGRLALVHAVGSHDDTHSHFEAMATMELGLRTNTDRVTGGWLARHLNQRSTGNSPLRSVAFSATMPDSLRGAHGAVAVNRLADYRLGGGEEELEAMRSLYSKGDDEIAAAGRDTLEVLALLNRMDPSGYRPDKGVEYPDSPLGRALCETAFLVKQDVGLEVCCLDSTGWDSHVAQGTASGWLYELARDLAESIAAFRTDLGSEINRVTIVVQSEFGRRAGENSGLGTDHGSGGAMMLLGGGVRGGEVYGDWPGLAPDQLTGPGDLRVTTDYRTILAELLECRHGSKPADNLFPGLGGNRLGLFN